MADGITGKTRRKAVGESIPAILAAAPAETADVVVKAVKLARTASKAPAKPVAKPASPAPVATALPINAEPVVQAKPVETPAPAPVAEKPAPVAETPAPVAETPAAEPVADTPAPVWAPAPEVPPVAAVPAPVETPPAAVPADTAKETKMATTIENAAQTTTDKAQAMFAETSERTKGAITKSTKIVEEMNAFGKGNVEALVESSKIAAKGLETMGQDVAEFTRKSFEDASAAFKTLASVKSPTEFMKLQSDYMRSAFDALVAESSRSTETVLKLAGEVAQPISNRMSVAADKMKVAA